MASRKLLIKNEKSLEMRKDNCGASSKICAYMIMMELVTESLRRRWKYILKLLNNIFYKLIQ